MIAPSPETILNASIADRSATLKTLQEHFAVASSVTSDLQTINAALAESDRPDLLMTASAPQSQPTGPHDLKGFGNFSTYTRSFGQSVYGPSFYSDESDVLKGFAPFTDEESKNAWLIGGHGSHQAGLEYGRQLGVSNLFAEIVLSNTLVKWNASVRMHSIAPAFTDFVLANLLQTPDNYRHQCPDDRNPELYAAYSILSRLVDVDDPYVTDGSGTSDARMLHH